MLNMDTYTKPYAHIDNHREEMPEKSCGHDRLRMGVQRFGAASDQIINLDEPK